jgi:hypothetical protein
MAAEGCAPSEDDDGLSAPILVSQQTAVRAFQQCGVDSRVTVCWYDVFHGWKEVSPEWVAGMHLRAHVPYLRKALTVIDESSCEPRNVAFCRVVAIARGVVKMLDGNDAHGFWHCIKTSAAFWNTIAIVDDKSLMTVPEFMDELWTIVKALIVKVPGEEFGSRPTHVLGIIKGDPWREFEGMTLKTILSLIMALHVLCRELLWLRTATLTMLDAPTTRIPPLASPRWRAVVSRIRQTTIRYSELEHDDDEDAPPSSPPPLSESNFLTIHQAIRQFLSDLNATAHADTSSDAKTFLSAYGPHNGRPIGWTVWACAFNYIRTKGKRQRRLTQTLTEMTSQTEGRKQTQVYGRICSKPDILKINALDERGGMSKNVTGIVRTSPSIVERQRFIAFHVEGPTKSPSRRQFVLFDERSFVGYA